MQDGFVGDIGDLAKLGLLRALVGDNMNLGVAWYLYPHEEGTAGQHLEYLDGPDAWRPLDPGLFDGLNNIIQRWRHNIGERQVMDRDFLDLLPGEVFADEELCHHPRNNNEPDRAAWRRQWFGRVMEELANCDIVFADPDNGLKRDANFGWDGGGGDWKRLPLGEALQLSAGRTTVIYHHNTRFSGGLDAEIAHWMAEFPNCTHAFRCRRYGNRTFFVLNAEEFIIDRLLAFATQWIDAERRAGIREDGISQMYFRA